MASGLRAVEGCREADFRGMILRSGEAAEVVTLHASPYTDHRARMMSRPAAPDGAIVDASSRRRRYGAAAMRSRRRGVAPAST